MRQRVGEALRRIRPDVVVTHLFRMAPYALEHMESHDARYILDLTDVISAGIERSLPYRSGPDLWIYREEMRRIGRFEAKIAPRFDECWVISEAERVHLERLAPEASIAVIPNGLAELPSARATARDRARLLFLGFHEVFHNRDAVRFLVQEIFPRVREAVPEATLDLAGKGSEALGSWARGPGVRIVGRVPRLEDAFSSATVFVAPHRFAAGVQNKVVHALATATPVVSTPAVREGLMPVPDGVMRVGSTAEEIARHVVELIRDPAGAAALGSEGACGRAPPSPGTSRSTPSRGPPPAIAREPSRSSPPAFDRFASAASLRPARLRVLARPDTVCSPVWRARRGTSTIPTRGRRTRVPRRCSGGSRSRCRWCSRISRRASSSTRPLPRFRRASSSAPRCPWSSGSSTTGIPCARSARWVARSRPRSVS
jgi:hypothetical protein